MLILGIETSCDETAVALVQDDRRILANCVLSQLDDHRIFGGVVPEIAARAHLEHLPRLVSEALRIAGCEISSVSAIAATAGPGLIGGVMVGVTLGKALALAANKPFLAVNHLEGHALTPRLCEDVPFPYLLLLASGGHCQVLTVEGVGKYLRMGTTIDDAPGEAFDKVAKMLNIGYPGGPAIEKWAEQGNKKRFLLPRPMKGRNNCDFSFSGLKNAVRLAITSIDHINDHDRADLAASFQEAMIDSIRDRIMRAAKIFSKNNSAGSHLVAAGGVAANTPLRIMLGEVARQNGLQLLAPPLKLCTDNAAMIAWAGIERYRLGQSDGFDFAPRPRWPLDPGSKIPPTPPLWKRGEGGILSISERTTT